MSHEARSRSLWSRNQRALFLPSRVGASAGVTVLRWPGTALKTLWPTTGMARRSAPGLNLHHTFREVAAMRESHRRSGGARAWLHLVVLLGLWSNVFDSDSGDEPTPEDEEAIVLRNRLDAELIDSVRTARAARALQAASVDAGVVHAAVDPEVTSI